MDAFMDSIHITEKEAGQRMDAFLSSCYEGKSRSFFQKLNEDGQIRVFSPEETTGRHEKNGYLLRQNEEIEIDFPADTPLLVEPENIPIDIVYEDSDVILVNKGKGMVVHPANGHFTGTLVNALLYHCKDLSGINGVLRPGIVHRIDKDTTGIVICCKNDKAHQCIASQLSSHSVTRAYRAIVCGNVKEDAGKVDAPIGRDKKDRKKMTVTPDGKPAVTHYTVLERFGAYTYCEFRLETGRTHQIRVHMASIGHPLLGDTVYGSGKAPFQTDGQVLHAYLLGFIHPSSGAYMEFETPLPAYFSEILEKLCK